MAEFSAFGPGYGECLLVHLGEGEWMIVDSCVQANRLPALDYLHAMGVDPAVAVKLVVATHWHDDHVRGIADVLAACPTAAFACSAALSRDELLQTIGALEPARAGKLTSGVKEMRCVLELLATTGRQRPQAEWAHQDRLLYRREGSPRCDVFALAPSDRVLSEAYQSVAHLVSHGASGRVPRPERNVGAVVLLVEVGDARILLGSDLQENPGRGWTRVLECRAAKNRRSEIFKVPHHGSSNGHLGQVWRQMLEDRPEAVVCPHCKGSNSIPTPTDLRRLGKLAKVHLTATAARRPMIEMGRPMRPAVNEVGRVTLRRRVGVGSEWSVSYGGGAHRASAR